MACALAGHSKGAGAAVERPAWEGTGHTEQTDKPQREPRFCPKRHSKLKLTVRGAPRLVDNLHLVQHALPGRVGDGAGHLIGQGDCGRGTGTGRAGGRD